MSATGIRPLRINPGDPGMFPNIRSRGYGYEPTEDEMQAAYERARYEKKVMMTGYRVFTFDLSDPKQVEQYREQRIKLYEKAALGEVVVHAMERESTEYEGRVKWFIHLEYSEYKFKKKDRLTGEVEDEPTIPENGAAGPGEEPDAD